MPSPYLPNTESSRQAMLKIIGVDSFEALFQDVPERYRNAYFNLPPPLSELELEEELRRMSGENMSAQGYTLFLGAGFYRHFIPAVVHHLAGRGEFYTAYTPYQSEVSQGTLQAIYDYQSLMCALTGMEVSNAGLYDGASAAAEAALMSCRITGRDGVVMFSSLNPLYQKVIATYVKGHNLKIKELGAEQLPSIATDTACIIVQSPNFFGYFEELKTVAAKARAAGALFVVVASPISLGMFRPPGEHGADIVVAEGQPLGNPLSFGGPGLGIFTCRKEYLRQMPGRLVGRTVDVAGDVGFVLTLATREQHIRRERATSNICTSEALVALNATIYLAAMGKTGLRRVAELCYHKAHYAAEKVAGLSGYSLAFDRPFFNEFVVRCPLPPSKINRELLEHGIIGGLDISDMIPNGMLLCVTELNVREEIDRLVGILGSIKG